MHLGSQEVSSSWTSDYSCDNRHDQDSHNGPIINSLKA
jgi:hypothetical protein